MPRPAIFDSLTSPRTLGLVLASAAMLALLFGLRSMARGSDLRRSWAAVLAAGDYRFEGTSRAQSADQSWFHHLRGSGDGSGGLRMEVFEPAVPALAASRYRLAWPDAWISTERGDPRPVAPYALAPMLPAGDPLAFLAVAQGPRRGPMDSVAGQDCRRVDFRVAARAYAAWWLAQSGWWPVNANSGGMHRFTARGSVWLDPRSDLPCRIALRIDLPRFAGEQAGWGEIDLRYSGW